MLEALASPWRGWTHGASVLEAVHPPRLYAPPQHIPQAALPPHSNPDSSNPDSSNQLSRRSAPKAFVSRTLPPALSSSRLTF